jgi:hypothetical protein
MSTTTEHHISQLSHHVDAMEELTEREFFTIADGSPLALQNLRARLARLQQTIEMAATK